MTAMSALCGICRRYKKYSWFVSSAGSREYVTLCPVCDKPAISDDLWDDFAKVHIAPDK